MHAPCVFTALQMPFNNRLHAPPHVTTAAVTNGCEDALRKLMGYGTDINVIVHINVFSLCTQIQSKEGATWQCVDVGKQKGWERQYAAHSVALELTLCVLRLSGETLNACVSNSLKQLSDTGTHTSINAAHNSCRSGIRYIVIA